MTQEEKELLKEVLAYNIVDGAKLNNIKYFMTNYVDDKTHVCGHCKAQIRFAHKRVIKWAERNNEAIFQAEPKVRTCNNCDADISHLDGRQKYCNNECKIAYKNR